MISKDQTRYPYTYACDWIRQAGLARDRVEASQVISSYAKANSLSKEEAARYFADKYVHYWGQIEALEEEMRGEKGADVLRVQGEPK